LYQRLVKTT